MTSGRKPYGHTAAERQVIETMRVKSRTRRGGCRLGPHGIARELNEEGVPTRDGKLWRGRTVERILVRDIEPQARAPRKETLGVRDYLTCEQVAVVVQACGDERESVIVEMMLCTGLRAAEICDLRMRDIDVQGGRGMVEVRCGKGGKRRSVAVAARVVDHVVAWAARTGGRTPTERIFRAANGAQLSYRALRSLISRVGVRAGLSWLHPHVLRHTYATLLYDDGGDVIFVKDQLGHASLATTQIYAKSVGARRYERVDAVAAKVTGSSDIREHSDSDTVGDKAGMAGELHAVAEKEKRAGTVFE